jgi:CcmD family protein
MSDLGWLAVALLAVWVGIGGYSLTLMARQRRLERKLDELSRRGWDR